MGATSGRGAGKGKDAKAVRISGYQNVFSEWNVVAPKIPPGLRMRLQSGCVSFARKCTGEWLLTSKNGIGLGNNVKC